MVYIRAYFKRSALMDNKIQYFSGLVNGRSFKSLFGNQALILPESGDSRHCKPASSMHRIRISKSYIAEWNELFKTEYIVEDVSFMYYWPKMIKFLMHKLLPDLGLNLRNVFHIGHESEIFKPYYLNQKDYYIIKNRLVDLCTLKQDKIILVTETVIESEKGETVYFAKDYTVVMNIMPHEIESVISHPDWNRSSLSFMKDGFRYKKTALEFPINEISFNCDNDLALRFGLVAGAVNITHGVWIISRYFKRGNPFLQGTCTANLIIMLLSQNAGEKIKDINVYFNNKLYLPGTVTLRFDKVNFELYDKDETMVSYGRRNTAVCGA